MIANRIKTFRKRQSNVCAQQRPAALRVGISSDGTGDVLKARLVVAMELAGYHVVDFAGSGNINHDDHAEMIVRMSESIATGDLAKGIVVCGRGAGASMVANRVPGVRAAFITDSFSAHQAVEEDSMNLMCLGCLVTGQALAWELVQIFLLAQFQSKKVSHLLRRLGSTRCQL